jgi:hypothetical protein
VIPSMFNLDHRIAELRPSSDEQRNARRLRDAALAAQQLTVVTTRRWFDRGVSQTRFTRIAAS